MGLEEGVQERKLRGVPFGLPKGVVESGFERAIHGESDPPLAFETPSQASGGIESDKGVEGGVGCHLVEIRSSRAETAVIAVEEEHDGIVAVGRLKIFKGEHVGDMGLLDGGIAADE